MVEFKSPLYLRNENPAAAMCVVNLLSQSVIWLSVFFTMVFEAQNILILLKSVHPIFIFMVNALAPSRLFYWPVSHLVVRFN